MKCKCGANHKPKVKCRFNKDPKIRKMILKRDNENRKLKLQSPINKQHIRDRDRKRLENPIKYKQKLDTNNNYYKNLKIKNPKQYKKRLKRTKINGIKYRREERINCINHYGGKCECCNKYNKCECCNNCKCNKINMEFLGIDHINGGGTKHRKEIKINIYRWLRINNYPKGFRVLCHNCNIAKGFYGKCPHQEE